MLPDKDVTIVVAILPHIGRITDHKAMVVLKHQANWYIIKTGHSIFVNIKDVWGQTGHLTKSSPTALYHSLSCQRVSPLALSASLIIVLFSQLILAL